MPTRSPIRVVTPARAVRAALSGPTSRPSESRSGRPCWHLLKPYRSYFSLLLPTRDDSSCDCVRRDFWHLLKPLIDVSRCLTMLIDAYRCSRKFTTKITAVVVRGDLWWRATNPSAALSVSFGHPEPLLVSESTHTGAPEPCAYTLVLRLDINPASSLLCDKRTTTTHDDEDSEVCRSLKPQPRRPTYGQVSSRTCSASPHAHCAGGVQQGVDRASSEKERSSGIAPKMLISGRAATEPMSLRNRRRGGTPLPGRPPRRLKVRRGIPPLDPLIARTAQAREVPVPRSTLTLDQPLQATIQMVNSNTPSPMGSPRTSR